MAHSNAFYLDGFESPTALITLRDLVRWLALRQQWEESTRIDPCDCIARRWALWPHEDQIYVEVVTGLNGQNLLNRFPGLSTLPVTPGDRVPVISGVKCDGHVFYFGPFADEFENL